MRKELVVAAIAVCSLMLAGCTEKASGKTVVMSLKELNDDFNYSIDSANFTYTTYFETLNPGDTLIIRDNISEKKATGNTTLLLLSSLENGGFYFDANLTDYNVGDEIEVTLHISEDIFYKENNGQMWKLDFEVLEEGWDFEQHTTKPLPADTIKHI